MYSVLKQNDIRYQSRTKTSVNVAIIMVVDVSTFAIRIFDVLDLDVEGKCCEGRDVDC